MLSRINMRISTFITRHRLIYLALFPAILLRRMILQRSERNLKERLFDSFFEDVQAGTLVMRIPAFQGSFEIDVRSHLLKRLMVERAFEPDIVEMVNKYVDPIRDVIDVGANAGFYTVLFSRLVGKTNKVLAIEPAPPVLDHLHRNIERNGCM